VFPAAKLRHEPFGRSFSVDRIRFNVFVPGRVLWAQTIRHARLAGHWRWVVVAVDVANESGRRFNPSRLQWRLDDSAGHVWAATYGGGTGDAGLARRGVLEHGGSAQMRLGFAVPRRARGLGLVWEAVQGGRPVRVALRRRG
jgi:hypothetical protein